MSGLLLYVIEARRLSIRQFGYRERRPLASRNVHRDYKALGAYF